MVFSLSVQSCYTYRTQAPDQIAVADSSAIAWSFAWGFINQQPKITNCNGQAFSEVTVKSNLAFDLLTVITLGAVSPKKIEWHCAEPCLEEGDGGVDINARVEEGNDR